MFKYRKGVIETGLASFRGEKRFSPRWCADCAPPITMELPQEAFLAILKVDE